MILRSVLVNDMQPPPPPPLKSDQIGFLGQKDMLCSETYENTIFQFLFFLRNGSFCTQILTKFGQIYANLI